MPDSLYQLDWYKSSLRNCCCVAKDETTLSTLSLVRLSPSPNRDLRAGTISLLRLSTLRPLLPALTTLSVCTAPTVGIIGENLTGGLGSAPNERPNNEDTKSSIIGSPANVCTAPTVGIIGENLTGGLGSAPNERPNNEDTKSSIIGSPAKLTDGSKSSPSAATSEREDTAVLLSLSLATPRQAATSEANP
ncbi:hypothetical protein AYI68_g3719 [Smittium mucronatum]|uniref:Uncharacterized protein n=1 Tax=Smittium mucronatum TaxID=133383 RepID=A0A1R0GZ51_9FUNG|nr:hypothetical protein AYI68_g3719 [Smittium mucronatum]